MLAFTWLPSVDASSDVNSGILSLGDNYRAYIQTTFTGVDVEGTLKLQASIDKVTWVDVQNSSQAVTASGNYVYDDVDTAAPYIRLAWTYTSGTGNITSKGYVKDLSLSSQSELSKYQAP